MDNSSGTGFRERKLGKTGFKIISNMAKYLASVSSYNTIVEVTDSNYKQYPQVNMHNDTGWVHMKLVNFTSSNLLD